MARAASPPCWLCDEARSPPGWGGMVGVGETESMDEEATGEAPPMEEGGGLGTGSSSEEDEGSRGRPVWWGRQEAGRQGGRTHHQYGSHHSLTHSPSSGGQAGAPITHTAGQPETMLTPPPPPHLDGGWYGDGPSPAHDVADPGHQEPPLTLLLWTKAAAEAAGGGLLLLLHCCG